MLLDKINKNDGTLLIKTKGGNNNDSPPNNARTAQLPPLWKNNNYEFYKNIENNLNLSETKLSKQRKFSETIGDGLAENVKV